MLTSQKLDLDNPPNYLFDVYGGLNNWGKHHLKYIHGKVFKLYENNIGLLERIVAIINKNISSEFYFGEDYNINHGTFRDIHFTKFDHSSTDWHSNLRVYTYLEENPNKILFHYTGNLELIEVRDIVQVARAFTNPRNYLMMNELVK
jgi:hypothetical protein